MVTFKLGPLLLLLVGLVVLVELVAPLVLVLDPVELDVLPDEPHPARTSAAQLAGIARRLSICARTLA
ncbi:MAG TPA: hypothetical protein VMB05_00010 [Solirubrobacteraceae bacterium]|nr:hypothetical protein [Solirubrobacteraceae bacterium]